MFLQLWDGFLCKLTCDKQFRVSCFLSSRSHRWMSALCCPFLFLHCLFLCSAYWAPGDTGMLVFLYILWGLGVIGPPHSELLDPVGYACQRAWSCRVLWLGCHPVAWGFWPLWVQGCHVALSDKLRLRGMCASIYWFSILLVPFFGHVCCLCLTSDTCHPALPYPGAYT